MCKGTRITSRENLYKPQKAGQRVVNNRSVGEQCCEISQPANSTMPSFSSEFLLKVSFGSIMHL